MSKEEILKEAQAKISEIEGEEVEVICRPKKRLPINRLKEAISAEFEMPWIDVIKFDRHRKYVLPRHIFCYLAHTDLNYGCVFLGNMIGRDHTSVVHARHAITLSIETKDDEVISTIENIRARMAS